MRLSKNHLKTLREAPSDAVLESHKLLVRANMIKQEAAGLYMFPKLGWRTVRKVEPILSRAIIPRNIRHITMRS